MVTYPQYQRQLVQRGQSLQQAQQRAQAQQLTFTQQQLRQTSFQQRQQALSRFEEAKTKSVAKIQQELEKQKQLEEEFKPKLKAYEQAKAIVVAATAERAAIEQAKTAFRRKQSPHHFSGSTRKYLEQLYEGERAALDFREKELIKIKAKLPEGEELIIDPSTLEIKEIESEYFQETLEPKKYIAKIEALQVKVETPTPMPPPTKLLELPDLTTWQKIKGIFKVTPKGIGISVPSAIAAMAVTPSPQEVLAARITPEQLAKIPVIRDIAEFEKLMKAEDRRTLETLGKGVKEEFIGATKAFTEWVTEPIEKKVMKLPYEVREKIAEYPGKVVTALGRTIKEFPIVKYPYKLMKKYPAPQEWKWMQKAIVTTIGKPFIPIEKAYIKEITPKVIKAPEGMVYITPEGKEVTEMIVPGREPGRFRFFMEKVGKAYEEVGLGLGETYFRAKELKWVDPWAQVRREKLGVVPWVGYEPTIKAKVVGKVAGVVGQIQPYFIPVVGTAAILAPFGEALGRRELGPYIRRHPWEAAIAVTWVGAKILGPTIKYARQPLRIPAEPTPRPIGLGVQVYKPTKIGIVSRAKLKLEYFVPGRKYVEVPRWHTWFYKKPIITEAKKVIMEPKFFPKIYKPITPAKIITTKAMTYIVEGEGIAVGKFTKIEAFQQRVGAKQRLMLRITGETGKITEKQWAVTPKKIKDLLRKAVQEERGGALLSDVNLRAYLRAGKEVSYAPEIKVERLFKYKKPSVDIRTPELVFDFKTRGLEVKAVDITYKPLRMIIKGFYPAKGKDVFTRMVSITETKPLYFVGTQEGFGIGVYRGTTAIGKVKPAFIKELIVQPGWQGAEPFSLRPEGIKVFGKYWGAKSSREYIQSLYKTMATQSKSAALEHAKQIQKMKGIFVAGAAEVIPKQAILPKVISKIKTDLFIGPVPLPIIKTEAIEKIIQKPILKPILKPIIKPVIKPIIKPVIKPVLKPALKPVLKPVLKPILKPIIKPVLKPVLRLAIKPPRPRPPKPPIKPPWVPVFKLSTPLKRRFRIARPKKPIKYVPFVKRYGRFIPVGKPVTLERARKRGVAVLRRTLARTLEVRKVGTGEPIPIAKVTRKFRPRRWKDIFGLVERAPFALEAREEVLEIIAARKAGRGSIIQF